VSDATWKNYVEAAASKRGLTPSEKEVIAFISNSPSQTVKGFSSQIKRNKGVKESTITTSLTNIYNKFEIPGKAKGKFLILKNILINGCTEEHSNSLGLTGHGLVRVHSSFPNHDFALGMREAASKMQSTESEVVIMQTFAPNLEDFRDPLQECLSSGISVRVLLAWPYSQAATLREEVLRRYATNIKYDFKDVLNEVLKNIEFLSEIRSRSNKPKHLAIRLYDTLPSLALYKVGAKAYVSPFLHGALAVDTFQLELDLNSVNQVLAKPILRDLENMWMISKDFTPFLDGYWRNDLRNLFLFDDSHV
jgi:hypothetical protein